MIRTLTSLASVLAASCAFANSVPADIPVPAQMKAEAPYMQNRICGELMASLARASADLYAGTNEAIFRQAAILAGTRAMVFVKANAEMTAAEGEHAKRIAEDIEKEITPENPVLPAYQFCEARSQRWLDEGVVTQLDLDVTEQEVREQLDKATPTKS